MSAHRTTTTAPAPSDGGNDRIKLSALHIEDADAEDLRHMKFKSARGGADTALALFSDVDEISQPHDPAEEKELIRKIDWMILPYLSVCYVFFYVSPSFYSKSSGGDRKTSLFTAHAFQHATIVADQKSSSTRLRSLTLRFLASRKIFTSSATNTAGCPQSSTSDS